MTKRFSKPQKVNIAHISFISGIILLLVFSLLWRVQALTAFTYGYDEGIHLIVARLWAAGYIPYQEIFVSYPPIFMWSLGLSWALFETATGTQILMILYSLTGVIAVICLGTFYYNRWAGLVAGVLLSFAPPYFISSFTVMTETPSIGLAAAAVALAETYRRQGHWVWALLSGFTLGFSLSLKLLPVYGVPMIGLLILARHLSLKSWPHFIQGLKLTNRRLYRDVAILAGSFLAVLFLPVLFFDLPAFYQQVVGMRLVSRETLVNVFSSNNKVIVDFLFSNVTITILALYGLLFVAAQHWAKYGWLLVWFGLTWASMYLHIPLREKHLPIFLPILVIFAGMAVVEIMAFITHLQLKALTLNMVAKLMAVGIVTSMIVWQLPAVISANNGPDDVAEKLADYDHALAMLNHISTPADCVIADDPVFLHYANRLPPAELAEASNTRIETGFLNLSDIVAAADKRRCHGVAVVTSRFGKGIDGLEAWLTENYLAVHERNKIQVYFGRKEPISVFDVKNSPNFGHIIRLGQAELSPLPWSQGKGGYISLTWQSIVAVSTTYSLEMQLRAAATGETVYENVRPLFEGQYQVINWPPEIQVRDTFWFPLEPTLEPGNYHLYVALCELDTGDCLPINDQPEYYVGVGEINVIP